MGDLIPYLLSFEPVIINQSSFDEVDLRCGDALADGGPANLCGMTLMECHGFSRVNAMRG